MKARLSWALIVSICCLVLAVCMQAPQWRHEQSDVFQGVAVSLNSDEAIYLARVQESLSGRPDQTSEAFTGHPNLVGTQFAMIERFYGTVFRFTGWRASQVLTFLDAVIPVLVFLSLLYLFSLCGFDRKTALALAILFCVIELYNLNRPIHMRSSFLVMSWALICIQLALRRHWYWVLPAGVLLGFLVGVYVWSFLFAWAFWGVYFVWEFGEWTYDTHRSHKHRFMHTVKEMFWHLRPRKPSRVFLPWHILLMIGGIGVVSAMPFVLRYMHLKKHPLFEYGAFRSGMHPGHSPESWVYSLLFVGAAACVVMTLWNRYKDFAPYRSVFVLLFAACLYMNQQLVHGITFNFVSHGIFSLAIAALAIVALAVLHRDMWLRMAGIALAVYLAAIAYDGRYVLNQWKVDASSFSNQYLAETLPMLDALPRGRFVSDPDTLAFIAGYTKHDVVYSVYLKNVLMSHREIALRYCLTQIPVPPQDRHISEQEYLVMPDAVSAYKGDTRMQEVALVESACAESDLDPALALEVHEVTHILWNRTSQPNWDISRFNVKLEEIASGEEWTLYRIDQ